MLDIWGVVSISVSYLCILGVGYWASRKGSKNDSNSEEEVMLAGRNIGLYVGIFTMTATWVGGGFINGTAEAIFTSGLVWCQAPFGYSLSLVFGGFFFAGQMRKENYVTMLDPFQKIFGPRMGGLLFLPALCGEIFWAGAILAALGNTLSLIIDLDRNTSVILSAGIVVFYTLFGGLYSVAYTDVIQLFFIFIGLWICVPFSVSNVAVGSLFDSNVDWIGTLEQKDYGVWIDGALLLIFGGIPWQVYFQRVLSVKSESRAKILSFVAAFGCFTMAIPPVIIGIVAKATDWNETGYIGTPESDIILPLVIQNLTPYVISLFGLGAVSAAVMSSADSSVLSGSSMFARNIYRLVFRLNATENEIRWVMKISIVVMGGLATCMALLVPSIYTLWFLCADLVYVILFPQLLMVVHFKDYCNTYGSLAAYLIGLFFRIAGGEPALSLPSLIPFPGFDYETETQLFPFKTFCMLLSILTLAGVSKFTDWGFKSGRIDSKFDYFKCFLETVENVRKFSEKNENVGNGQEMESSVSNTIVQS